MVLLIKIRLAGLLQCGRRLKLLFKYPDNSFPDVLIRGIVVKSNAVVDMRSVSRCAQDVFGAAQAD